MTTPTRQFIIDNCSAKVFERGQKLLNTVEIIAQDDKKALAKVAGTKVYTTSLKHITGQTWRGECNCPAYAEWDGWCKHLVALGLVIAGETPTTKTGRKAALKQSPYQLIQEYLNTQDVAQLRSMIMERAENDTQWFKILKTKATTAAAMRAMVDAKKGKTANTKELAKSLRQTMRQALKSRRFIEYYDTIAFADNAQQFLQELPPLIKTHPLLVKELLDDAFDDLEHTLENSEDDGAIQGLFADVLDLHKDASKAAINAGDLDPAQLGKELFLLESQDQYGLTSHLFTLYHDILGEAGRKAFEDSVDHAWQQLPICGPDDDYDYGRNRTIQRMRETIAERRLEHGTGKAKNLTEVVEVFSKDLSSSYRYYQLAKICADHHRDDLAQRFAIQGLENFPNYDDRLLDLIGEIAVREDDPDLALSWYKRVFTEHVTVNNFKRLRTLATQQNRWDDLRDACLKAAEQAVLSKPKKKPTPPPRPRIINLGNGMLGFGLPNIDLGLYRDGSILVEILLLENEIDHAWEIANKHGCRDNIWQDLAAKRAKTQPAEIVPLYQKWIHQNIGLTNKDGYAKAHALLKKLKPLMVKTESPEAFGAFVQSLREQYKAKRNMMKLLAEME